MNSIKESTSKVTEALSRLKEVVENTDFTKWEEEVKAVSMDKRGPFRDEEDIREFFKDDPPDKVSLAKSPCRWQIDFDGILSDVVMIKVQKVEGFEGITGWNYGPTLLFTHPDKEPQI